MESVSSFRNSLNQILSSFRSVQQSLPSHSNDILLTQLRSASHHIGTLNVQIKHFEKSLKSRKKERSKKIDFDGLDNAADDDDAPEWELDIDAAGVWLWNQSTYLRRRFSILSSHDPPNIESLNEDEFPHTLNKCIGALRQCGSSLFALSWKELAGPPSVNATSEGLPYDGKQSVLQLLRLYTKAAEALCESLDLSAAGEMLERAAPLCDELSRHHGLGSSTDEDVMLLDNLVSVEDSAKAIIEFYCVRGQQLLANQQIDSARFMILTKGCHPTLLDASSTDTLRRLCERLCSFARTFLPVSSSSSSASTSLPQTLTLTPVQSPASSSSPSNPILSKHPNKSHSGKKGHSLNPDLAIATKAAQSIDWFSKSLEIHGRLGKGDGQQYREIERHKLWKSAMVGLVSAYKISSPNHPHHLFEAERIVDKILETEPDGIIWREKVKLVIARKGDDCDIIEAFCNAGKFYLPHFEEETVIKLIGELHTLPEIRRGTKFSVLVAFLEMAAVTENNLLPDQIDIDNNNPPENSLSGSLATILLAVVFMATEKDSNSLARILDVLEKGQPSFRLTSTAAFSAQSVFWKLGDRLYSTKHFEEAAIFYEICCRNVFVELRPFTFSACWRKSALARMQAGNYEQADQIMISNMDNEACSHYVLFQSAILRSQEDEALRCLHNLTRSPSFELKMLLWASKQAHDRGMRHLLQSIFSSIFSYAMDFGGLPDSVDMLVLARCLVRSIMESINNDTKDHSQAKMLAGVLRKTLDVIRAAEPSPEILKESIEWFSKAATNMCLQMLPKWPPDLQCEMLDIAVELTECCRVETNGQYAALLRFTAITSRLCLARQLDDINSRLMQYQDAMRRISHLRATLSRFDAQEPPLSRIDAILITLEFEVLIQMESWSKALQIVKDACARRPPPPLKIFHQMADLAMSSPGCPCLSDILQLILASLLDVGEVDIKRFNIWLRTIASALLENDCWREAADHFTQAAEMVGQENYSFDEAQWLLSSAWDRGIDAFTAQDFEQGQVFCQLAVRVANQLGNDPLTEQLKAKLDWLLKKR